jgi:hypothetical protein
MCARNLHLCVGSAGAGKFRSDIGGGAWKRLNCSRSYAASDRPETSEIHGLREAVSADGLRSLVPG